MKRKRIKPFWSTLDGKTVRLYQGDVIAVLKRLPSQSVHMVVTSPPYWGLRDYGTAEWEGGNKNCDHLETNDKRKKVKQITNTGTNQLTYKHKCKKCGAKRIDQQIGSEKTPEEFVAKMVEVFREVKRVLRDDGTLWLNLGSTMVSTKIESEEMVLRDAITDKEKKYVLDEIAKCL